METIDTQLQSGRQDQEKRIVCCYECQQAWPLETVMDLYPQQQRAGGLTKIVRFTAAQTSKAVKKLLSQTYPGVRFSVRINKRSLHIKWIDGPARVSVEHLVLLFEGARLRYNTSTGRDYPVVAGRLVDYGVEYIRCERGLSVASLRRMVNALAKSHGWKAPEVRQGPDGAAFVVSTPSPWLYWEVNIHITCTHAAQFPGIKQVVEQRARKQE